MTQQLSLFSPIPTPAISEDLLPVLAEHLSNPKPEVPHVARRGSRGGKPEAPRESPAVWKCESRGCKAPIASRREAFEHTAATGHSVEEVTE